MADLVKLKTELKTDPLARGYSGMTHEQAAVSLNTQDRQADRGTLDGGLLVASIVRSEYAAAGISATDRQYVQMLVSAGSVPLTTAVKQELGVIFPAGSQTRANLIALLKRTGSRAEELGIGHVTPSDVADALRS